MHVGNAYTVVLAALSDVDFDRRYYDVCRRHPLVDAPTSSVTGMSQAVAAALADQGRTAAYSSRERFFEHWAE